MRAYETIIIFNTKMNDSELENESQKFAEFLKKNGASDVVADTWGKRELAYELRNGSTHGSYLVFYYSAKGSESLESNNSGIVNSINQLLKINESVMKHQTHRISESVRKFKGRINNNPEENIKVAPGATA